VGTTKNKSGRFIYLTQELRALLETQWQEHLTRYPDCPWVFNNHGRRSFTFYKAWYTACREAGLSGKIPHDFRRTAASNFVRAGVDEKVAMRILGHKTPSVFRRYHIVTTEDVRAAAEKVDRQFTSEITAMPAGRKPEER